LAIVPGERGGFSNDPEEGEVGESCERESPQAQTTPAQITTTKRRSAGFIRMGYRQAMPIPHPVRCESTSIHINSLEAAAGGLRKPKGLTF